jgi:diguanylate cyclase (GGDEF)-like protein/putative nucleotidyltransferase with HDIG domain
MAVFTLLNHLMIGLVVWFARGENFSKSGVFDILPLMIDFTLLCMGAATALIWLINPFAIPLILLPLYLIYTTLKVPALERKTKIDAKTGLNNAKYFAEVLEKEIERADRFDRPLTVVLADLDLLRHINNTYGHLAGDEVLIGVANLLQNFVREYDIVARFGGEEFIILMPETTPQEAYQHIEDIRIAVERTEFSIPTADQGTNHLFSTVDEKTLSQNQTLLDERVQLDSYKSLPNPIRDSTGKTKKTTADPEPSLVPAENPTPSWLLNLFIGSLIFIALPLTLFFVTPKPSVDWFGLFLFSVLVIITEGLSIDIYLRNTSISTSAAPIIAGTLLYGPIGAVVLSLTFALVAKLKHHNRLNRFVFNSLNQMIAGLLYVNLITLTGKQFSDHSFIVQLLVSVLAAMIVFLSTTALISLAIKIDAGISVKQVWKEKFSWMLPYYISMGLIAYALILGYRTTGLMGLIVILAPLLMLRISVKKYIDQTTAIVNELRGKNTLLERNSQEINKLNENLLDALSEVIDLRDPFTLGHSQYVTRYSVLIAKKLGLAPKRIERVRKASLIHDIGKIGIPDAILLKPNQLSAKEYVAVQEHTTLGANILDKSHSLKQLSPIVRHHHEWYDGSGYPDRLKGKDIPLEARIIAIADAVEAMASDRPYRNALSFENIVAELKRNSGSQFDPVLVEIMLQIVQTRNEYLLVNSAQKLTVEQCEYAFLNH